MDMESQVADVIREELARQAADRPDRLTVSSEGGALVVQGSVDLEALAMAVVGAVAGGP